MAREAVLEYRRMNREGKNPGDERRNVQTQRRQEIEAKTDRTFEKIARAKHES
jgi:hypothetical protein